MAAMVKTFSHSPLVLDSSLRCVAYVVVERPERGLVRAQVRVHGQGQPEGVLHVREVGRERVRVALVDSRSAHAK
jgi:hypothetical protein